MMKLTNLWGRPVLRDVETLRWQYEANPESYMEIAQHAAQIFNSANRNLTKAAAARLCLDIIEKHFDVQNNRIPKDLYEALGSFSRFNLLASGIVDAATAFIPAIGNIVLWGEHRTRQNVTERAAKLEKTLA